MIPWLEHKEKLLTCSFGGYHFTNPAICFDALSIAKNSQCQFLYHTQFQEISPLSPFDVSSEKYQSVLPNTIVKSVIFINNQKTCTVFFLLKLAMMFCPSQEKPNVNFYITRNSRRFPRWVLLIFVVWKIQVLVPNSKVRLVISITNQKVQNSSSLLNLNYFTELQ